MQKSKQVKLDTVIKAILEDSLAELLPQAAQLVRQGFCPDCPHIQDCRRAYDVCPRAQLLTKFYLDALATEKARLN